MHQGDLRSHCTGVHRISARLIPQNHQKHPAKTQPTDVYQHWPANQNPESCS